MGKNLYSNILKCSDRSRYNLFKKIHFFFFSLLFSLFFLLLSSSDQLNIIYRPLFCTFGETRFIDVRPRILEQLLIILLYRNINNYLQIRNCKSSVRK